MQQGVLLGGMRGADGMAKYDSTKYILRWYRRCTVRIAFDGGVINVPYGPGGGSYTGPSFDGIAPSWETPMNGLVDKFIQSLDALPHHFVQHLRNGIEIIGYKHPDERIRNWWHMFYCRLVNDEHLNIETEEEMDYRLGDNYEQWRSKADDATAA
jgi:hypothetical protein